MSADDASPTVACVETTSAPFDVHTWLHAFLTVRATAMKSCGLAPEADDVVAQWPRTTGADVVMIASVVDPCVRALGEAAGAHSTAREWQSRLAQVQREALAEPRLEFSGNRELWQTLLATCNFLHSVGAPLPPPDVWQTLIEHLADNARGTVGGDSPFKAFAERSLDRLGAAQQRYLGELRGIDACPPEPGTSGGVQDIPRTTNTDVVLLADYWNKQIAETKAGALRLGDLARWIRTLFEVDRYGRAGEPAALYRKNNRFWRDLRHLARQLAAARSIEVPD